MQTTSPRLAPAWLLALLLPCLPAAALRAQGPAADAGEGAPVAEAQRPLLVRVAVIGASVSAGFGNGFKLAKALDPGIAIEHDPVADCSTASFFLGPLRSGKGCLDKAIGLEPTMIVAIDYLFWYGYGNFYVPDRREAGGKVLTEEEVEARTTELRLERLEKGLKELDRWEGPLVVGDFPDMTGADARMISPRQIPGAAALVRLNERVGKWVEARRAKDRPTVLVSLKDMVSDMRAGRLDLPASPDGDHAPLVLPLETALLWDRLHPTKVGVVALVDRIWKSMAKGFGDRLQGLDYEPWRELERMGFAGTLERKRELPLGTPDRKPASRPAGGR